MSAKQSLFQSVRGPLLHHGQHVHVLVLRELDRDVAEPLRERFRLSPASSESITCDLRSV